MPVVSPRRRFRFIASVAIVTLLGIAPALADMTVLTYNTQFARAGPKRMSDRSPVSTMVVRLIR